MFGVYARFLRINIDNTMATMMTKTNKPTIAGTKYRSAADGAGVGVGDAVGAAVPNVE